VSYARSVHGSKRAVLCAFLFALAFAVAGVREGRAYNPNEESWIFHGGPRSSSAWRVGARPSPPRVFLPRKLERALDSAVVHHDPFLLADSTLPRLADLSSRQRQLVDDRICGWPVPDRVAAWAFLEVGVPYELGPLGEEAPPDTQPVIAFKTADCATLNLVAAALAHRVDAGSEQRAMARANYRNWKIQYDERLHFTTDRLDVSPYYRDITSRVAGALCERVTVRLNRRRDGSHWIPIAWTRKRVVAYVPRALGTQFPEWFDARRLPDATGVAFVQRAKLDDGLDVVHESLLWKGRTLLHASSRIGHVVTVPWTEFLEGPGKRYDGFVLFEYR